MGCADLRHADYADPERTIPNDPEGPETPERTIPCGARDQKTPATQGVECHLAPVNGEENLQTMACFSSNRQG